MGFNLGYMVTTLTSKRIFWFKHVLFTFAKSTFTIKSVSAFGEYKLNNNVARGYSVSNVTLLTQYRGETSAFAKNHHHSRMDVNMLLWPRG